MEKRRAKRKELILIVNFEGGSLDGCVEGVCVDSDFDGIGVDDSARATATLVYWIAAEDESAAVGKKFGAITPYFHVQTEPPANGDREFYEIVEFDRNADRVYIRCGICPGES